MKGSEQFKTTLLSYLQDRASKDKLFAQSFSKSNKNIDNCVTYILNTVKKSGANGFADEEIYGMAVHYYDEDKIDIGGSVSGSVVINHQVELTEEEKKQARAKVMKDFEEMQLRDLRQAKEHEEKREKKKKERLQRQEAKRAEKKEEMVKSMNPTLF